MHQLIRSALLTALFAVALFHPNRSSAQVYYTVKFPDDQVIYSCGGSADTILPLITQYSNCSYNVGVAVQDQVFYTNSNGTCKKILRTFKLLYWCDYNPNWPAPVYIANPTNSDVGPTVNGDVWNHGYISYTQIIKVVDNVPPVFLNCPTAPVVFCDYTNNDPAQYNNYHMDRCEGPVNLSVKVTDACSKADIKLSYRMWLDLDGNGSMETYISSSDPNAWPITTTVNADTLTGKITFPAGHGFPYGTHKIEWIANDKCAGDSYCKYEFIVKDCKAPTVTCINGLSVNIMQTGMITLWDTDFVLYYQDNCTPNDQIKIAICKSGQCTSFPFDQHGVTFTCAELGPQSVQIWAIDSYGNADFCETFINVQDNMGSCPPSAPFKGSILTDEDEPVPGVQVALKKSYVPVLTATADALGQYAIGSQPASGSYMLQPSFTTGPANAGVNTMDALLVSAHIAGTQKLPNPYRIIAADANHSGTITTVDVDQIVKVANGSQPQFVGSASWRFVPQSYTFPNPLNPFSSIFPEKINLGLSGPITVDPDFVAIKTGDVDNSLVPASQFQDDADTRTLEAPALSFHAPDLKFTAGEEVRVPVYTPDLSGIAGFQFGLNYNAEKLTLTAIEPGLIPEKWINSVPESGDIAFSWHDAAALDPATALKGQQIAFTLVFEAKKNGGTLREIEMTSALLPVEGYSDQLEILPLDLAFDPMASKQNMGPELYAIRPNPASDQASATFYLPEDGEAFITLTDASGQVMFTSKNFLDRGYHEQSLDLSAVPAGLLFLRLETDGGVAVKKVVKR